MFFSYLGEDAESVVQGVIQSEMRVVSQPHHVFVTASAHARHKCGKFWRFRAQMRVILDLGGRAAIYGGAAIHGGRGIGAAMQGMQGAASEGTVAYRGGEL